MRTLLYLSGWMTQLHPHKCICKYRRLVNWNYPWKLEHYRSLLQTRQQAESLQTGKEYEGAPLFRRGSPLACGVMGITCSSFYLVWWSRLQTNKKAYPLFKEQESELSNYVLFVGVDTDFLIGGGDATIENGRVYVHFH